MPTGYTAGVQTGKVKTLKEFAMTCAREFGALMHMKEEALYAEVVEAKPDDFYPDRINELEKELNEFMNLNRKQQIQMFNNEIAKNAIESRERIKNQIAQKYRYESMLSKAKKFVPPTPDHQELKKFMINQLEESIRFDCNIDSPDLGICAQISFEEWKEERIYRLNKSLKRSKERWEKEKKRVEGSNKWVRQLQEALEKEE